MWLQQLGSSWLPWCEPCKFPNAGYFLVLSLRVNNLSWQTVMEKYNLQGWKYRLDLWWDKNKLLQVAFTFILGYLKDPPPKNLNFQSHSSFSCRAINKATLASLVKRVKVGSLFSMNPSLVSSLQPTLKKIHPTGMKRATVRKETEAGRLRPEESEKNSCGWKSPRRGMRCSSITCRPRSL